ncbi:hypothetical protein [Streptococcus gallolyticus]|uniref:hypothetical protein n=1 Tax=Streptococcus gallolyticus TaxID=315405 RepID=UPI002283EAC9|nr:hypothetical protein [Streptococcus gallolyticus]MCY7192629.1 hypothetical protein [Streptococcus gallolyticus subsp. gallolyticus]MDO4964974.1 hypothetical protein [Streptococcus gallolyticus]
MGITNITWEEYETFTKVETPDELYIRENNGHFYTFFELGIASVRRIFEINAKDFEVYLAGKCSGKELRYKAQNDAWPPTEEEKKIAEKESVVKSPTVLIDIPKYRKLFTYEELERLIPIAEQQWIDWKGKLPDDYVSPLK